MRCQIYLILYTWLIHAKDRDGVLISCSGSVLLCLKSPCLQSLATTFTMGILKYIQMQARSAFLYHFPLVPYAFCSSEDHGLREIWGTGQESGGAWRGLTVQDDEDELIWVVWSQVDSRHVKFWVKSSCSLPLWLALQHETSCCITLLHLFVFSIQPSELTMDPIVPIVFWASWNQFAQYRSLQWVPTMINTHSFLTMIRYWSTCHRWWKPSMLFSMLHRQGFPGVHL